LFDRRAIRETLSPRPPRNSQRKKIALMSIRSALKLRSRSARYPRAHSTFLPNPVHFPVAVPSESTCGDSDPPSLIHPFAKRIPKIASRCEEVWINSGDSLRFEKLSTPRRKTRRLKCQTFPCNVDDKRERERERESRA